MRELSVYAFGLAEDDVDSQKIHVMFREDGFFCDGVETNNTFVAYAQIQKYGTSLCKRTDISVTYVYVRYSVNNSGKQNELSLYLNFASDIVIDAVLEIFLERVECDPLHYHDSSFKHSTETDESVVPETSRIDTIFVITHVTFVRFVDDLILAGVGDHLQVYSKSDSNNGWKCLATRQIFCGQHIHGVQLSGEYMVIFGGRKVSFAKLCTSGIRIIYSFLAPDWVLDCKWLASTQLALLTANNALALYNLSIHKPVYECVHYCVERCILYSGTILGKSWNDATVLAGTVFSTIAIWSNSGNNLTKEIIHRLEGHKGVIFSISYSDTNQRICSTSDDRTVRVWDVKFGSPFNWKTCTISLTFTLYGHSARVWKSAFFESGRIVSIGEDSRVCLWYNNGKLQTQYRGHQDGEVWSLDISEQSQLIATGGSDGGIDLWPTVKMEEPYELRCGFDVKPKCVGLSEDGRPFMVSWNGDIFLFNNTWTLCLQEPALKSYCIAAVTSNRRMVAFASIIGRVIICRFDGDSLSKVVDLKVCEGRIYSLMWTSCLSIVICGSAGKFSLWKLTPDSTILGRDAEFILPHSKERWVTSCAVEGKYLVCGDRCGSLYLYSKGQSEHPLYVAKKIHGQNGVTDVKFLNGHFVSTGRDGKYREYSIEQNQLLLLRCHHLKMNWAAAVHDSDLLGRVIFCFREMSFVIWNVKDRKEIVKIDCGGGHRSWDCLIDRTKDSLVLTYIKGCSVNYCRIPINSVLCHSPLPGHHPKAINSAGLLSLSECAAEKLILMGGEDTTLRLVSVGDGQTELRVLQGHLSSVRAVASHRCTFDDTLYIVSGGGRGQLVFWKVRLSPNTDMDVVELNSYSLVPKGESDVAEMRVMDLQVYQSSSSRVMIAGGCSDGMLRILFYSAESNCTSEAQAVDCKTCLLSVCVGYRESEQFLLATTTCGTLLLFSIGSSGLLTNDEPDKTLLLSETGINSCDYIVSGEQQLIVACAGDDGLLTIVLFDEENVDERFVVSAHTCQVSGLKIVNDLVITAALDQKLAIFTWAVSGKQIHAELINRMDVCIPDIHGVLAWPVVERKSYRILVYGLGTQLVTFSRDN